MLVNTDRVIKSALKVEKVECSPPGSSFKIDRKDCNLSFKCILSWTSSLIDRWSTQRLSDIWHQFQMSERKANEAGELQHGAVQDKIPLLEGPGRE